MNGKPLRIVLAGAESAGIQALQAIERGGHTVVAVLAPPPDQQKDGRSSLWEVAAARSHPTWPAKLVKDPAFAERLLAEDVDILLNVFSLYLVDGKVLESPRYGCFNLHPGPLPRYAGLNSVQWAVLRGERTHGVTLHRMTTDVDCGAIVSQSLFEIGDNDTALSVMMKCVKQGLPMVRQLLEMAATDPASIPSTPQDPATLEFFGRKPPSDLWLRWGAPARDILRCVRACDFLPFSSPWGHPRAQWMGREIEIARASPSGRSCHALAGSIGQRIGPGVEVATADEWILAHTIVSDQRYVEAKNVLQPGQRLQDGALKEAGRV